MYKKRYISLFFAIFVIVGAVVFFALSDDRAPVAQEIAVTTTPAVVEQVSQNIPKQKETTGPDRPQAERENVATDAPMVTLAVGTSSHETSWHEGMTVIDAMKALKNAGMLSFNSKEFLGLGLFVEEISGKKNADGFYWILYINGEKAGMGASQTILAPDDMIEWKYESR